MKVAPVLGIMIGSIALRYLKGRQDIVVIITVILILTLAYAIELGMHNIYKYKLMKDYADYVRTFKLPVKEHKNKPV